MRLRWIGLLTPLLFSTPAKTQQANVYWQCLASGLNPFCATSAGNPLPVNIISGGGTITLPTIGAAVPATGIYDAMNVGGNLTGMVGVASGTDGVSNTLTGQNTYSRLQMFNGTTWDRVLGDTTSGLWVNVKSSTGVANPSTASGETIAPIGAESTTAARACSNGNMCALNLTPLGGLRSDNASWAGTALGTPTNFGTTPGAVVAASVNSSLFIGTTVADGNSGNKGAGTQRNVLATDQLALATWGHGATGAAPPSGSTAFGTRGVSGTTGGLMQIPIVCDSHIFKHITSATDTLAVQGVASQTIYICNWRSRAAGTATWYLENTNDTNANCNGSKTQITGVASEVANSGEVYAPGYWQGLKNTSGNGLCINSTGTGGVDIDIWYAQF